MSVAKAGARVLMLDRKQRLLNDICQRVEMLNQADPAMIEFDITQAGEADYRQLAEGIASLATALDGVVHCALAAWPLSSIVNSKIDNWYRIYDREVVQPMVLMRSLFPIIQHSENPSIVFCTMSAGRRGRANWGAVGSAFAALENVTETLGSEWESHNIRVNTIDISNLPSDLRTRYYPGEVVPRKASHEDFRLQQMLIDLFASKSMTNGQRMTV